MVLTHLATCGARHSAHLLVACALLAPVDALVAQAASLQGRISDVMTAVPVPYAEIQVVGVSARRRDTADADGRYVIHGLDGATYRVRVEASSYAASEVLVTLEAGSKVTVDLALTRAPRSVARLRRVLVQARRTESCCGVNSDSTEESATSDERAPWRTVVGTASRARGSLVQSGALASAERPAPGFDPSQRAHALFVWGAEDEQGRLLVDGVPLDVPLQVAGLLPPLDPKMLTRTAVRTAGATPRFDGGLAYVVDVTTRTPRADSTQSWGEVDALAIRTGLETALGSGAVAASVRRVNGELAERVIGPSFRYSGADAIVRGAWPMSTGRLRATAIGSSETVVIPRDQATDRSSWQNAAGVLAWDRGAGHRVRSMAITAGRGAVNLPVLSVATGHLHTRADRVTAAADGESRRGAWQQVAGASIEYLRVDANAPRTPSDTLPCAASQGCWKATSVTVSAFAERSRRLDTRWRLSGGARLNGDASSGGMHVLPRAALTVDVGPGITAGVSGGRYSQVIADWSRVALPGSPLHSGVPSLRPTHASQWEVGVQWLRSHSRVVGVAAMRRQDVVGSSRKGADVSTIDLGWVWSGPRLNGTLAYGGAFVAGAARPAAGEPRARHVASGRLAWQIGRATADLTAAYSAGLPFTSIVLERPSSAVTTLGGGAGQGTAFGPPSGPRLRVDAALRTRWRVGHGTHALTLEPYALVMNALNRQDAVFYYRSASDAARPQALAVLPRFVSLGIRWAGARVNRDRLP